MRLDFLLLLLEHCGLLDPVELGQVDAVDILFQFFQEKLTLHFHLLLNHSLLLVLMALSCFLLELADLVALQLGLL